MGAPFASMQDRKQVQLGMPYYTWVIVRSPIWPGDKYMAKYATPLVINASNHFRTIRIDSIAFWSPDETKRTFAEGNVPFPMPADMASGRAKPFTMIVQWHKFSEDVSVDATESAMDPVVKILIYATLLGLAGFLAYRAFTKGADELKGLIETASEGAAKTAFNPGFLILAVVAMALLMRGRT